MPLANQNIHMQIDQSDFPAGETQCQQVIRTAVMNTTILPDVLSVTCRNRLICQHKWLKGHATPVWLLIRKKFLLLQFVAIFC